jgi:hypothetical protein
MKNLTDILPALPQVPAESIVRLGLSMVAYSAFNDTLRRQLDPANDRPQRAQLMHPLACLCQHLERVGKSRYLTLAMPRTRELR